MKYRKEWTPTQIAANTAHHARRKVGFTQDVAVEELAPLGCVGPEGKPWKKANLSALEAQRLPSPTRHRGIDADTIMAMSLAYEVSPLSFFIPPTEAEVVVIGEQRHSPVNIRAGLCGLRALGDIRTATVEYGGHALVDVMLEQLLATYGIDKDAISARREQS